MKKRLFEIIILAIFGFILLILGTFFYWDLEGIFFHKITNVTEVNFKTTKQAYYNDEIVEATFDYCKFRDLPATIQWSLVDTYERTYPAKVYSIQKLGCFKNIDMQIEQLPIDLPPDVYHFSGTAIYHLNPLRNIVIYLKTNEFKIK